MLGSLVTVKRDSMYAADETIESMRGSSCRYSMTSHLVLRMAIMWQSSHCRAEIPVLILMPQGYDHDDHEAEGYAVIIGGGEE